MRVSIIILCLGCNILVSAQGFGEQALLMRYATAFEAGAVSEAGSGAYTGFIGSFFSFYKKYISTQDHMSCVFAPSCSEYAYTAIRRQGLVAGLLNAFDRLTRCNGLRPGDYTLDPRLKKLSDPVRDIRYELH